MNPRKAPAIKDETEKLLKDGFIYLVPLMEWVSNPIPIDKKQEAIHICTDFRDLNRACPKDNFTTPFIDHIWMSVRVVRCSPSWMAFLGIIRFKSNPRINIILHLFFLRVLLHIGRCLLALKMLELHFSGR